MNRIGSAMFIAVGILAGSFLFSAAGSEARNFKWTTESKEAKRTLLDLQNSIENFQAGPALAELARKIVSADPEFAMGEYYLSAVIPPGEATSHLECTSNCI